MKPGDRVELTESMLDLPKGAKGTVCKAIEHPPFRQVETTVMAVQFDHLKFPAISREILDSKGKDWKEGYVSVLTKCKPIC